MKSTFSVITAGESPPLKNAVGVFPPHEGLANGYQDDVHRLQDGEWVDITFDLARQPHTIVPVSGDSVAFAAETQGIAVPLVSMSEGESSIRWTLVGVDGESRPRRS